MVMSSRIIVFEILDKTDLNIVEGQFGWAIYVQPRLLANGCFLLLTVSGVVTYGSFGQRKFNQPCLSENESLYGKSD